MMKPKAYAVPCATAIAAALALSSTPVLAQETGTQPADPVTLSPPPPAAPTDSIPTVDVPPIAVPDTSVAAPDSTTATTADAAIAPAPAPAAKAATRAAPARSSHVSKPAATAAAPAAAVAAAPSSPALDAAPPAAPATDTLATVNPAPPPAPAPTDSNPALGEEVAGGGLLALLILGAAGFTLARRRRDRVVEEQEVYEPDRADEPAFAPAAEPIAAAPAVEESQPILMPSTASAFSWGNAPAREPAREAEAMTLPNGFDLSKFGPHVRAAYRGPTPDNPSLSLRHRLKRAAFFDQRERQAAEGKAVALEPDAGLPEKAVSEREHEFA